MHKEEIRLDDQDKISEKTNINRFNSAVLKFIDKSWNPPSPYSPLPFIKLISPATIIETLIETLTPLEPIGRGTPTPYLPPNLEATRPANSSAFGGGMHF